MCMVGVLLLKTVGGHVSMLFSVLCLIFAVLAVLCATVCMVISFFFDCEFWEGLYCRALGILVVCIMGMIICAIGQCVFGDVYFASNIVWGIR